MPGHTFDEANGLGNVRYFSPNRTCRLPSNALIPAGVNVEGIFLIVQEMNERGSGGAHKSAFIGGTGVAIAVTFGVQLAGDLGAKLGLHGNGFNAQTSVTSCKGWLKSKFGI